MFNPEFKYTHKIVNLLTKISTARELIVNSPLIPKWEVTIRRQAIIQSAHSSTSIEGNMLSLEQVSELAIGRAIMASRKDKQEVLNYLYTLENLAKLTDNNKITEQNILNIHKMLTKNTLENPTDSGIYRKIYVVVANRITKEIIFRPPPNENVPALMQNLVTWMNSTQAKELDPVIEAGITHYELVRIHPFVDGNGRTARVLASLIFFLRDFDIKQFFCLDDYYDSDRPSYYKALKNVNQKTLDLTNWLEYFAEGVNISINTVKERVIKLSSERLRKTEKGQIALTERQMQIVEHINKNGKITNKELREKFKISNRAALDEINKLLKLKILQPQGKGRNFHYTLT